MEVRSDGLQDDYKLAGPGSSEFGLRFGVTDPAKKSVFSRRCFPANHERRVHAVIRIRGLSVLSFRFRLPSLICLCVVLAVAHSIY